jgi:Predicted acyl-CoA transferases/carnitine dehydratase
MPPKPAYDDLIQGATALPALMAQTSDGVPRYVPNALVDRIVGLTAVGAICASLVDRDRTGAASASISRCSRPWRVCDGRSHGRSHL